MLEDHRVLKAKSISSNKMRLDVKQYSTEEQTIGFLLEAQAGIFNLVPHPKQKRPQTYDVVCPRLPITAQIL